MVIALETQPIGRGKHKGPQVGAYVPVVIPFDSILASATRIKYWNAPFNGRFSEISAYYDILTGAAPNWKVTNDTTALNLVSDNALPAARTVDRLRGTQMTSANRNFSQNDIVSITITAGVGEAVTDLVIVLCVYPTDHVVSITEGAEVSSQED